MTQERGLRELSANPDGPGWRVLPLKLTPSPPRPIRPSRGSTGPSNVPYRRHKRRTGPLPDCSLLLRWLPFLLLWLANRLFSLSLGPHHLKFWIKELPPHQLRQPFCLQPCLLMAFNRPLLFKWTASLIFQPLQLPWLPLAGLLTHRTHK